MAEGIQIESDNSSLNRKPATDKVWDIKLFQNIGMAGSLACIECGHPPRKCYVDHENQTLCELHAEPLLQKGDKINRNTYADGLIAGSEIVCPNILYDPTKAADEKKEEPKQCEKIILIKDWKQKHNDTDCQYTIVDCEFCHSDFTASRCLQAEHIKTCPYVTIECEQKCGLSVLRKDQARHIKDDCAKTILDCTNPTCTEKIARELFKQHVTQLCPKRIVECEYKKHGCAQLNVKAEEMQNHMQQFEIKHLQFHLKSLYLLVNQQQQQLQHASDQSGMIRMFGGSAIPNGWLVCDGQNGTPDLKKMFVLRNNEHNETNDDFDVDQISECEMEDDNDNDNDETSPSYAMIYIMKV